MQSGRVSAQWSGALRLLTHSTQRVSVERRSINGRLQGKTTGSAKGGSETSGRLKSTTESSDGPGSLDVIVLVGFCPFEGFEAAQPAALNTSNSKNSFVAAEFSM
jgi:hypothetical protein